MIHKWDKDEMIDILIDFLKSTTITKEEKKGALDYSWHIRIVDYNKYQYLLKEYS